MKNISINEVRPDMIAGGDIVTAHGQIIAGRGALLTEGLIAKLRFYGIREITIADSPDELMEQPAPAPVAVPEPVAAPTSEPAIERDASTYSQRIKQSSEFQEFQDNYNRIIAMLEHVYENIRAGIAGVADLDVLLNESNALFQKKTPLDLLNIIHSLDGNDSIYASAINVALISRGIGRWLKLPTDSLNTLTLAGLLHDIGKTEVPPEVLNKTGKLTNEEFDLMKKHTLFGQRLLRKVPGIDPSVVASASQHHEKYDGTGYPMGLMGDEIDPFAAIVAIADVYEAMTALRPHRKPLSPFQVIESFEGDGLQKYNPKFILTFLQRIASAYQNRMVVLSDGRKARIIYLNQGKLSHPIVEFEDKTTADLSRTADLHIVEVI